MAKEGAVKRMKGERGADGEFRRRLSRAQGWGRKGHGNRVAECVWEGGRKQGKRWAELVGGETEKTKDFELINLLRKKRPDWEWKSS